MELSAIDRLAALGAVLAVWMCGLTRISSLCRGLALNNNLLLDLADE
jgi:hypothetical protein